MSENTEMQKLRAEFAILQSRVDVTEAVSENALIRTYAAEAALAHVLAGKAVDYDVLEEIVAAEFKDGEGREQWAREAVRKLRKRVANPSLPQEEE